MGNQVNSSTPVMTAVKVVNSKLEFFGKAGYVVEPPKGDADAVGVKMDDDAAVYEFDRADIETLA